MVRAWYMDNEENDPQLEHHRSPPEFISQEELREKTGVECLKLNIDTLATDGVLDKIKQERNYNSEKSMEETFVNHVSKNLKNIYNNKMVRAWYMDNDKNDPELEHHRSPPEFISQEELNEKTGVECLKLNVDTLETDGILDKIQKERDYNYGDVITVSKECRPDWKEWLKTFYAEHLHPDEETRLVLEGSGYFDVRDKSDQWIRIEVRTGDMLILPGGIYHRFTLDLNNYIKMKRFFSEVPQLVLHNRPAEDMTCRKKYLDKMAKGFAAPAFQFLN